jgi:hypothetical protein
MIVVFVGPTLEVETASGILDARYLPPAANGDVIRAVTEGATAIGIIDGYFEWTLSVWHKEILWALARGTHVLGAASMGALRAAELAPFGMRGVGRIFELYRDGMLEDDDEVAVAHEPGGAYTVASEAMINIRCTLAAAVEAAIISAETRQRLQTIGKRRFYPDRRYEDLLATGRQEQLPPEELDALATWLPANQIDQKRADALALVRELQVLRKRSPAAHRPTFTLNRSVFLDRLLARVGASPEITPP